jgi:hypothetical protein
VARRARDAFSEIRDRESVLLHRGAARRGLWGLAPGATRSLAIELTQRGHGRGSRPTPSFDERTNQEFTMRNLSSVLIQVAPKRRQSRDESSPLDSLLRSIVEEGPRWRSRARRDTTDSDAGWCGSKVVSDPRDARSSR